MSFLSNINKYIAFKQYDEALEWAQKAKDTYRNNDVFLLKIQKAISCEVGKLLRESEHAQAMCLSKSALEIFPENPYLLNQCGSAAISCGQYELALNITQIMLERRHNISKMRTAFICELDRLRENRAHKAMILSGKIHEVFPDDIYFIDQCSRSAFESGNDYELGFKMLEILKEKGKLADRNAKSIGCEVKRLLRTPREKRIERAYHLVKRGLEFFPNDVVLGVYMLRLNNHRLRGESVHHAEARRHDEATRAKKLAKQDHATIPKEKISECEALCDQIFQTIRSGSFDFAEIETMVWSAPSIKNRTLLAVAAWIKGEDFEKKSILACIDKNLLPKAMNTMLRDGKNTTRNILRIYGIVDKFLGGKSGIWQPSPLEHKF